MPRAAPSGAGNSAPARGLFIAGRPAGAEPAAVLQRKKPVDSQGMAATMTVPAAMAHI